MKRMYSKLFALLLVAFSFAPARPAAAAPPPVTAESYVLMDVCTGEILFGNNVHRRMEPASTTKILTAIVAIERGKLDDRVTVSEHAARADGSSIWLKAGETRTVRELLYGLLLSSGNDAAIALAEHVAGDEQKFMGWMNEKARELGATETTFVNPNGLPDPGHLTTVLDMAVIARYALHNPFFSQIVQTRHFSMPWPEHEWDRALTNHNKMLWRYSGADGVKTGYTRSAGHCLVTSATRDGQQLLAVVFKSRDIYADTSALLNWGFDNYTLLNVAGNEKQVASLPVDNGTVARVRVVTAEPLNLTVPRSDAARLRVELDLPESLTAPVQRQQRVGSMIVHYGDQVLTTVGLVAATEVPRRGLLFSLFRWIRSLFQD